MSLPVRGAPLRDPGFDRARRQLELPENEDSCLGQALDLAAIVGVPIGVSQFEGDRRAVESEPGRGPMACPWLGSRSAYLLASLRVRASASATLEGSSRPRNTGVTSARSSWAWFAP